MEPVFPVFWVMDDMDDAEWERQPVVGDLVCDCRFKHIKITEIDGDDVVLEDGHRCSLKHCLDPVTHHFEHPELPESVARDYCQHGNV